MPDRSRDWLAQAKRDLNHAVHARQDEKRAESLDSPRSQRDPLALNMQLRYERKTAELIYLCVF